MGRVEDQVRAVFPGEKNFRDGEMGVAGVYFAIAI
jgi:hypothetical protein